MLLLLIAMKNFLFIIVFLTSFLTKAQEPELKKRTEYPTSTEGNIQLNNYKKDSTARNPKKRLKNLDATHYKMISMEYDTIHLDTTITIYKDYKHNLLRKDLFGLLPFQNMGQAFNSLSYSFEEPSNVLPQIGVSAKQFNYLTTKDIYYYHVPTPFSDIMHKTGMERGQVLSALVTTNVSPEFNLFIGYKGLHSTGKYQRSLSSHGNLQLGFSYDKKQYRLRGHYAVQDLHNEENSGLTAAAITAFETNDENFTDRRRMLINRIQDSTIFRGKRIFIDQSYQLIKKDSAKVNLAIFHQMQWEKTVYTFEGIATTNDLFGASYRTTINDSVSHEVFSNKIGVKIQSKYLGTVSGSANYSTYNYGYNSILNLITQTIPDKLTGGTLTFGGTWHNKLGGFTLDTSLNATFGDLVQGNQLYAKAAYQLNNWQLSASILNQEKTASFNKLLYQSEYKAYNWYTNFDTEKTRDLTIQLNSKKWGAIRVSFTNLDDYIYFGYDAISGQAKPIQYSSSVNYLKLKYENDLHFGKFGFANTILFQEVTSGTTVFKVPQFVTRNSIYYTNYVFDNAMELQVGATVNYFSKYQANDFNALLNEFVVQDTIEIGAYPTVDFFVNARVMRARLFLKAEHINSSFSGRNYYSSRNNPYHDFMVRFGLVWNFLR